MANEIVVTDVTKTTKGYRLGLCVFVPIATPAKENDGVTNVVDTPSAALPSVVSGSWTTNAPTFLTDLDAGDATVIYTKFVLKGTDLTAVKAMATWGERLTWLTGQLTGKLANYQADGLAEYNKKYTLSRLLGFTV